MILISVPFVLLILQGLYLKYEKAPKQRFFLWIVACIYVWMFIGLRSYYTGNDTIGYVRRFLEYKDVSWGYLIENNTYRDPRFVYFVKFCSVIFGTPVLYLCFTAFISLIGVFLFIKENAKSPILCLFFWITIANYSFAFTGIRQAISMSMCMLAGRCIINRKYGMFCVWVAVGWCFHHSALLFAPMYFLCTQKLDNKHLLLYMLITAFAVFYYEQLLSYVGVYLNYETYGVEDISNGFIYYSLIIVILVLSLLFYKEWRESRVYNVLFILSIYAGIIWTFRLFSRTAERPAMYFINFLPLILDNSFVLIKQPSKRKTCILGFALFALLLFIKRNLNFAYFFFWQDGL